MVWTGRGTDKQGIGRSGIRLRRALTVCVSGAVQDAYRRPETQGRCPESMHRLQQTRVMFRPRKDWSYAPA